MQLNGDEITELIEKNHTFVNFFNDWEKGYIGTAEDIIKLRNIIESIHNMVYDYNETRDNDIKNELKKLHKLRGILNDSDKADPILFMDIMKLMKFIPK